MVISNSSRFGYSVQTDLQDRAQRIAVAPESIGVGDASRSSRKAHETESKVEELVQRYLHSSPIASGILHF